MTDEAHEASERVREFRRQLDLTLAAFAAALRVDKGTASRWETGSTLPSYKYLARMFRLGARYGIVPQLFPGTPLVSYSGPSRRDRPSIEVRLDVDDVPGVLLGVLQIIHDCQGDVQRLLGQETTIGQAKLTVWVLMKDRARLPQLLDELEALDRVRSLEAKIHGPADAG